ncbi:hypothetical protein CEXT_467011 [Caerostris extrusa]|uniref:Uncharacterized protein n=1 Tax=Caerostris extrusa TaxID=172846 RepID=A0AAV4ULF0_CAEEX|nr:hypothetical protein CEXT_467011 [Caerostris extrusa]
MNYIQDHTSIQVTLLQQKKDESPYQSHQTDITKPILIGETATSEDTEQQSPSESQERKTFGDSEDKSSHISSDSSEDQKSDSSGATRPPITGFVPPSLDIDLEITLKQQIELLTTPEL